MDHAAVEMSANPMDARERALRAQVARDIREWADEMDARWAARPPEALPRVSPTDDLRGVADLVEGGYRGNCSRCCDDGQHAGCTRQQCVCACHRSDT